MQKKIAPSLRARAANLPHFLKILSLVFVVMALARPQESSTKVKKQVEGIDIVLTMDISDSMLIEDMEPVNRLESARKTMIDFVKRRASDRIGLVFFMGEAFTKVPLTLDHEVVIQALREVEPSRKMKMGTAIGVGLATGVSRIKDSTAKSRVVVLMTDGENNTGTIAPESALEIAKGFGVRVYTIGMGRDGEAQLPVYSKDIFGNSVKRYQPMHSKVNDELLDQIATETGGKYWRATSGKALEGVFSEIDRLEKSKVDINQYTRYTELFPSYLIWGIALFCLSLLLKSTVLLRLP